MDKKWLKNNPSYNLAGETISTNGNTIYLIDKVNISIIPLGNIISGYDLHAMLKFETNQNL